MKKYGWLLLLLGAGVAGWFLLKKKKPVSGDMAAKEAGELGEQGGGGSGSGGGGSAEDMSEDFQTFQEGVVGDSFTDPTSGDFGGDLGGGSGSGSGGGGAPLTNLYPEGFGLPETNIVNNNIVPPPQSWSTHYLPGQAPWELTDVRQVVAETAANPKVISTVTGATPVRATTTPKASIPKVEVKSTPKGTGIFSTKPKATTGGKQVKPAVKATTKRITTIKKAGSGKKRAFDGQSEILN